MVGCICVFMIDKGIVYFVYRSREGCTVGVLYTKETFGPRGDGSV